MMFMKKALRRTTSANVKDGSDFVSAVWPGWTHFPDVLNADARAWFGQKYERLISKGIDGFWNDMNEPAMFCTPEGVAELKEYIKDNFMDKEEAPGFTLGDKVNALANNPEDYKRFYHNVNGQKIRHDKVHNLFGYNMTRAAGEAFEKNRTWQTFPDVLPFLLCGNAQIRRNLDGRQ